MVGWTPDINCEIFFADYWHDFLHVSLLCVKTYWGLQSLSIENWKLKMKKTFFVSKYEDEEGVMEKMFVLKQCELAIKRLWKRRLLSDSNFFFLFLFHQLILTCHQPHQRYKLSVKRLRAGGATYGPLATSDPRRPNF